VFIHHFPVNPTGTPLENITDPSQITDFNGFVGLNRIRGVGVGTGARVTHIPGRHGIYGGRIRRRRRHNTSFGFI
jgi:hypothetical protein